MTDKAIELTVFRGVGRTNRYVWSPFVCKLECRLRLDEVSYKTEAGNKSDSPNGKIPFVKIPNDNGEGYRMLSDSDLVAKELVSIGRLSDINNGLSPADCTHDLALRALLEHKLYFYQVKEKWIENYYAMRDYTLAPIPFPIRVIVGLIVYRTVCLMLYGQGTTRFTAEEIADSRQEVWQSLENLLKAAKKQVKSKKTPFWILGGDSPTEADTTLYGFIASGLTCAATPASQGVIRGFPTIMDYAGRIHDRYFPDYDKWDL